jgi:hypothetical protein
MSTKSVLYNHANAMQVALLHIKGQTEEKETDKPIQDVQPIRFLIVANEYHYRYHY